MWPFNKPKKQLEFEAALQNIESVVENFFDKLDEMKKDETKEVPCLVLYFENGCQDVFEYDSVIKRNKEASQLRLAITEGNDWCYFKTQNNRDVMVDARTLTMVSELDKLVCCA